LQRFSLNAAEQFGQNAEGFTRSAFGAAVSAVSRFAADGAPEFSRAIELIRAT
jgi:hypothetical protein